jgi:hypothetical protein
MIGGTLRCRGAHIKRQKLTFIVITSAQFNDEARATVPVVRQFLSLTKLNRYRSSHIRSLRA